MNRIELEGLYAYHHWATDCLLAAVASLPDGDLERPLGGSFGAIHGLLTHLIGAELLWLERWRGRSPTKWPDLSSCRSGPNFQQEWATVKAGQRDFLADVTPESLAALLTYVNLQGERFSYPLGDVLLHVVNHGTYHRGQIAHMLRQLAQRPPGTDYLLYHDEQQPSG